MSPHSFLGWDLLGSYSSEWKQDLECSWYFVYDRWAVGTSVL